MNPNIAQVCVPVTSALVLVSELTCPECLAHHRETMPTDACQYLYVCRSCDALLKPKIGDCCVFCSFGTVPCPPRQAGGSEHCGKGCGK